MPEQVAGAPERASGPSGPSQVVVLVVEHEPDAPAAWLGDWLVEAGCVLDVRRPYADDQLPPDLRGHQGLLVLGGAMDCWDDDGYPWLAATRALIREADAAGVPTLGVCLGHQLATLALGGEVGRNPAGGRLALLPVGWTPGAAADPVLGRVASEGPQVTVHGNNDVALRLPDGAEVLAVDPDGAVQAARLGRSVWGVQCHPEVGAAILERWLTSDPAAAEAVGVDPDALLEEVRRREPELRATWRPLADAFAEVVRSGTGPESPPRWPSSATTLSK